MSYSTVATFAAGLGLFLVGVFMLNSNMKQLASRRLREWLSRMTQNTPLAILVGTSMGFIIQKNSVVSFLLANMVNGRMLTLRKALPVCYWGTVGVSLVVFILVFQLKLAILFALGIMGVCLVITEEKASKSRFFFGASFGIALLFYGLSMIKMSSQDLRHVDWLRNILAHESLLLNFFLGVLIVLLTQSLLSFAAIVISWAEVNLLSFDQSLMMIFGGVAATGFLTLAFIRSFRGAAKQIIFLQGLTPLFSSLLFVAIFWLERAVGSSAIKSLLEMLSSTLSYQIALVILLLRLPLTFLATFFPRLLLAVTRRFCPMQEASIALDEAQYINDLALNDTDLAIELLECEQLRLLRRLPLYVKKMQRPPSQKIDRELNENHRAFHSVCKTIHCFAGEIVEEALSSEASARIFDLTERQHLLQGLEEQLFAYSSMSQARPLWPPVMIDFHEKILSHLDALLKITIRTLAEKEEGTIEEPFRKGRECRAEEYLEKNQGLDIAQHTLLMSLAHSFERQLWLMEKIVAIRCEG